MHGDFRPVKSNNTFLPSFEMQNELTMKKMLIAVILLCTLNACRRPCNCSINETCNGDKCECSQWTEGTSCTPMRDKFIGIYTGTISVNVGAPSPDTIDLYADGKPVNYLFSHRLHSDFPVRGYGVRMESPHSGVLFADYLYKDLPNQYLDNFNPIDCGNAVLASDDRSLTITYHPLLDSILIDFSHTYVFTGSKQ
jgi:hypothetical protein